MEIRATLFLARAVTVALGSRCCLRLDGAVRISPGAEPFPRKLANPLTMTDDAKTPVVTIASISDDVSAGAYCERMRISDVQCRAAWLGLMDFILNAIRNNKVRRTAGAQSVLVWLTSP
jgi:hypothetical protein